MKEELPPVEHQSWEDEKNVQNWVEDIIPHQVWESNEEEDHWNNQVVPDCQIQPDGEVIEWNNYVLPHEVGNEHNELVHQSVEPLHR